MHPARWFAVAGRATSSDRSDTEGDAGWNGFFLWDHLLYGPVPVADPWVALTAIALNTRRLRFGPMVTPVPRRDPFKLGAKRSRSTTCPAGA